jgi:PAS domain S-box-containing protein
MGQDVAHIGHGLLESEKAAHQLADTMPHIVWTAGSDGAVDYFNRWWYEYTGMTPEASLSLGWRSAVHPDDVGRFFEVRNPAVEGGQVFQSDVRLRDREGTYRWHMVRSVPVRDESGRVIRRFGTATDIDDRVRAEEASRAGEQRFRFLAESIPHMVWTAFADGSMEYASPRFSEYLGVAPEQVQGSGWLESLHPDDRSRAVDAWEHALGNKTEYRLEYRLRHGATGEYRWFLGHALPQRDADGRVVRWYGTCTDIDSQWRAQQEIIRLNRDLRARVDELEAIFDTVPIGIAIAEDVACSRIRPNPTLEQMLELAPGSNMSLTAPPQERPGNHTVYRDGRELPPQDLPMQVAARTGQPVTAAEVEVVFTDGRTRMLYGNASPLFDEGGAPRGSVGAFLDITSQKDAEAQLNDAKNAAETASRAKDRFLAVLSHELRTPLAPVLTQVALLQMTPGLSPEMRESLAMIRRNIELETRLIDDLLDLSRVISGKLRLDRQPTHLNDLVLHVLRIVGDDVHEKGLVVESRLIAGSDLVDADPARLQQVIWNLVKNAAKFTPSGGRIRVTTQAAGEGEVEVVVRDSGKGISPEALPFIFDAFEQGDPSITQQFGGLGLGLSIAKAIVSRHAGTIRAASDGPGRGSSFTVTLPLRPSPPDESRDADAPADDIPSGRVRVLFVEDHADTAGALTKLLQRSGYHVEWADRVASALELAAARPFDVVVSDLGLPDGTGYDLMRTLKERYHAKGIALSGFGMEGDIQRGHEAGFCEHLVKPVDVATLDQAIRRVTRLHQRG